MAKLFNETINGLHLPNLTPIHAVTEMSFAVIFNIHTDIFRLLKKGKKKIIQPGARTKTVLFI